MNIPDMSTMSTLGLGAGVAAIAAGWRQVKSFLERLSGIFLVKVVLRSSEAIGSAKRYCVNHLTVTPSPFHFYYGAVQFVRPKKGYSTVIYEELGDSTRLYWKGFRPVWVEYKRNSGNNDPETITFRFFKWTFDPDRLVIDVVAREQAFDGRGVVVDESGVAVIDRFRIIRKAGASGKNMLGGDVRASSPKATLGSGNVVLGDASEGRLVGWNKDDIGEVIPRTDPLERLALTEEVVEVVEETKRWYKSKQWYSEREIPWRRGILLHGPPGTGKSSLVKALAQTLNMPIYLMDISTMDNDEFHSAYTDALSAAPALVLIEDIDAVFHMRENVSAEKGKGMTFDCLLNTVSGVQTSDGILLVVTTNNLDKVDPAIGIPSFEGGQSSRPGRIDRAVMMPALGILGRRKLATRILAGCDPIWIEKMVKDGEEDTGAQFEDRCASKALELYWAKK